MVGMKSGNMDGVGQKWITFQAGSDPYGFVRDGQWHTVEVPVSDLGPELDFSEVSQLFQILGTSGPIPSIELDDIYFAGGARPSDQRRFRRNPGRGRHQLAHARGHELHHAMDGRPGHQRRLEHSGRPHGGRWHNPLPV